MPFSESVFGECTEDSTTVGFYRPEAYYDISVYRNGLVDVSAWEMKPDAEPATVLGCFQILALVAAVQSGVDDTTAVNRVMESPEFVRAFAEAMKGHIVSESWSCGNRRLRLNKPIAECISVEFHRL